MADHQLVPDTPCQYRAPRSTRVARYGRSLMLRRPVLVLAHCLLLSLAPAAATDVSNRQRTLCA
eukprot:2702217-Rhodomonas_salina.2